MPIDPSSSPLHLFAAELRHYRNRAGLIQAQLADRIGYSASLVAAIETARRVPRRDLVGRCDKELNTDDALMRLFPLVKRAAYPASLLPFLDYEEASVEIRAWEPLVIPGLLQTEDYARAVITAGQPGEGGDSIDEKVEGRAERQRILDRDNPPLLWVIISEIALRCQVGGHTVMREQLGRLLEASARPKIIIQVVTLDVGAHPGLGGPLELLTQPGEPEIAYFEVHDLAQIVEHPEQVTRYSLWFDMLRAVALSPERSRDLIASLMKEDRS